MSIYISMFMYVNIHEYTVQSLSHVIQLRSYGLQCTLFPYPLLFPGVCSNSCPLSRWWYPIISFSVTLFSSCSVFPSIRVFSNKLALCICEYIFTLCVFPGGSEIKASAHNTGDPGSVPGLGRFPGGGDGTPPQYSCLENSMDRGTWQATAHEVPESQTWLSYYH